MIKKKEQEVRFATFHDNGIVCDNGIRKSFAKIMCGTEEKKSVTLILENCMPSIKKNIKIEVTR